MKIRRRSEVLKPIGLYIHIPFCKGKCPYCDFYSLTPRGNIINEYTDELCRRLSAQKREFDTVYFGGGTPSLLGEDNISRIMEKIGTAPSCEITLECNPSDTGGKDSSFDFGLIKKAGINRISMGLQSASDEERRFLGRRAGADDAQRAVEKAKKAGIDNISLDLMLGLEGQNAESVARSIEFCTRLGARHLSAYLLKLEQGTPLYTQKNSLRLPDEDEVADLYLFAVSQAEKNGFFQYEISNFSQKGYESKHNLKYWQCEEYLGLGAAAHSFVDGKRYYYERDIDYFLGGGEPTYDGEGGDREEYIMLSLRLTRGLNESDYFGKYHQVLPKAFHEKAEFFKTKGLMNNTNGVFSLTPKGFLLSNRIIFELIETLGA